MKKRFWEYTQPLFAYIIFGCGVLFLGTLFCIMIIIFRWKDGIVEPIMNFYKGGGYFVLFLGALFYIYASFWSVFTGQMIAILEISTIGLFQVSLSRDGIYGKIFIEYMLSAKMHKRAEWDDIVELRFKSKIFELDGYASRVIFKLKDGTKFIVPNFGIAPVESMFYRTTDQHEREYRYSNRAMYGIILRMIGKDKFVNFPKKVMTAIEEASKNVDSFFEENPEEIIEEEDYHETN